MGEGGGEQAEEKASQTNKQKTRGRESVSKSIFQWRGREGEWGARFNLVGGKGIEVNRAGSRGGCFNWDFSWARPACLLCLFDYCCPSRKKKVTCQGTKNSMGITNFLFFSWNNILFLFKWKWGLPNLQPFNIFLHLVKTENVERQTFLLSLEKLVFFSFAV